MYQNTDKAKLFAMKQKGIPTTSKTLCMSGGVFLYSYESAIFHQKLLVQEMRYGKKQSVTLRSKDIESNHLSRLNSVLQRSNLRFQCSTNSTFMQTRPTTDYQDSCAMHNDICHRQAVKMMSQKLNNALWLFSTAPLKVLMHTFPNYVTTMGRWALK